MRNNAWVKGWEQWVGVTVAAAVVAGCATTGTEQPKKGHATAPNKKAASAKVVADKANAAKPLLPMPKIEKAIAPPVVIPAFDWQHSTLAPGNRGEVLAKIDKKERADDFDAMIRVTDMDGKQLAGFLAAADDRLARLAVWTNSAKGKRMAELEATAIPAARQGTDEAKLKTLAVEHSQLAAEFRALRTAARAMVMGVMTLPQQRVWAAQTVKNKVDRMLRGVSLDTDQQKKALAIYTEAAAGLVQEDTVAKDPYLGDLFKDRQVVLDKTVERIKADVLTESQRTGLAPRK
jgi:hypothetical protein